VSRYACFILITAFSVLATDATAQSPYVLYNPFYKEVTNNNLKAAIPLAEALINEVKKKYPGNDDSLHWYLLLTGNTFYSANYQEQSIPYYQQLLAVKKRLYGEDHSDYQASLASTASIIFGNRKFNEAEPLYEEIRNYRRKKYNPTDSMYINGVFMLANVWHYQGRKQEAIATFRQVKKWYDERNIKILDYVSLLLWFGQALYEVAEFREAELQLNQAKTICYTIDEEHWMYFQSLHFLGLLYIELGVKRKAEICYDELLAHYKKTPGAEIDYASALSEMAAIHLKAGRYIQTEDLLNESLKIRKQYNASPSEIANSYNELAVLYMALGNYPLAESSLREALALREKYYGKDKSYATYLHNIAVTLTDRGNYLDALPLEKEVAEIYGKFKDNDAGHMQSLANVAYDLVNLKRLKEAQPYLDAALKASKKVVADHPHLYELYMLAGIFKQEEKQYEAAAAWYLKGHELNARLFGADNDDGSALNRLTNLYILTGNYAEAYKWQKKKNEFLRRKVATGLEFLSEAELVNLSADNNFTDGPAIIAHRGNMQQAAVMLYDNLLFIKGLALNNNSAVADAIHSSGDTALVGLWDRTNELKKLVYEQEQLGSGKRLYNVDSLMQLANNNEKLLVKRSQQVGEKNAFTTATWKTVQHQLDEQSCSIEFVRYKNTDKKNDSAFYAALVITKNAAAQVFVKLCSEATLQQLLNRFNKNGGDLYVRGFSIKHTGQASSSRALYNLVWKPLEQHLEGVQHIYFSPDGLLHRVAFSALPVNDSISLLQQYRFTQLFSTRNAGISSSAMKPKSILLAGGINFNEADKKRGVAAADPLAFVYKNRSADMAEFKFLPGTLEEVTNLSTLSAQYGVATTTLSGTAATETYFRTLPGKVPTVIHISTHGFSLADEPETQKMKNSFSAASDPLVRCGLVMAGGNVAWKNKEAGNANDGILTGKEISTINMRGCELAVLSACETGLGNIRGTEGVFGLQRALKTAGVQSVIVSLWPVPDKETVEFMQSFYTNWFSTGNKEAAFRYAQLQMQRKYNPAAWAAFVLIQ